MTRCRRVRSTRSGQELLRSVTRKLRAGTLKAIPDYLSLRAEQLPSEFATSRFLDDCVEVLLLVRRQDGRFIERAVAWRVVGGEP